MYSVHVLSPLPPLPPLALLAPSPPVLVPPVMSTALTLLRSACRSAQSAASEALKDTVDGRTCTAAGRPAGSIYFRLACAPAARGARPRACHLAAAASVQIWVVSTVLLLYGTAQRSELLSVVAPDHYRSGSRVVTGSCDPQPQQQPCIQPQNCCCWPRGRARGLSI